MIVPAEELERIDAASAQAGTELRRLALTALRDRLQEHIERVGPSPGITQALDEVCAKLGTPR